LPDLNRYYALIRRTTKPPFDVGEVARMELEWWIIHRQWDRYSPADLDQALAELQAGIYRQSAGSFAEHAKAREVAMLLRDVTGREGSPSEADGSWIGVLLDDSWTALHRVVNTR
jgi:hypothetical protein